MEQHLLVMLRDHVNKMKTEKVIKKQFRKSRRKAQYLAQKVTTDVLVPLASLLTP